MAVQDLTPAQLRELLDYDPLTGLLRWRVSNGSGGAGKIAGGPTDRGYWRIAVGHKLHRAHRVAWAIWYGEWPQGQVDHINRIRSDNRLVNLRVLTLVQNRHNEDGAHSNNRLGIRGVHVGYKGKFIARIGIDGKELHLGVFNTAEEASNAYKSARARLQPFSPDAAQSLGILLNHPQGPHS